MTTLIAGGKGLIGSCIFRHLIPDVRIYDLPQAATPLKEYDFGDYGAFIDCARYEKVETQIQTWRTVIDHFKQRGGGKVILFSSIYGHKAPDFSMYPGTEIKETPLDYAIWKGGTEQAVRYLAKKYRPWHIQVNAIAPGGVLDNHSEEFQDAYIASGGVRMIQTKNILPVVDMLLHPDNAVNGQVITVDGGFCL